MRPFVDTHIVIYALSDIDPRKQAIAQRLLAERGASRPSLSTQVLAETFNVLTRKLRWAGDDALAAVTLLKQLRVVAATPETTLQALALAVEHQLSGWDALIVQAAQQAGCDLLYSEDLQTGRRFGSLEVLNPFELAAQEASSPAAPAAPKALAARAPRRPRPAPRA